MASSVAVFGQVDLNTLVECSRNALAAEDGYLLKCATVRRWKDQALGIRENPNERYYQFLIWRELRRCCRWRCETERQGYDLAFYDDEANELVAYAEIKRWWSDLGNQELPQIQRDIHDKLAHLSIPGIMLVLTWNYKKEAEQNLDILADALKLNRNDFVVRAFDTVPWPAYPNDPTEIMIIGLFAPKRALGAPLG